MNLEFIQEANKQKLHSAFIKEFMEFVEKTYNPKTIPMFKKVLEHLVSITGDVKLNDVVTFAALEGMPRGEIVNLQRKDVDLPRRPGSVQSIDTFTPKRGKRCTVPMDETIFQLLRRRLVNGPTEYVFTKDGQRIGKDWSSALFRKHAMRLGLNPRPHFHSLRASVSWLVPAGMPVVAVSKLPGHSDVATSSNHYARLFPENLHNEVTRLKISLI